MGSKPDSRSGQAHVKQMYELMRKGGVWDEADISSIARHGIDGSQAADSLFAQGLVCLPNTNSLARLEDLLRTIQISKDVWNVNETTLYRSVLYSLGLGSNLLNGVSLE